MANASDCGSEDRGFESLHSPHFLFLYRIFAESRTRGCRQAVRHGTLTPAFAGSTPAAPAKCAPLAQSVEHLTFNQGVRGSNPRWGTIHPEGFGPRVFVLHGTDCRSCAISINQFPIMAGSNSLGSPSGAPSPFRESAYQQTSCHCPNLKPERLSTPSSL